MTKNPNALDGEIITIRRGLAIYKVNASPYYFARIRDSRNGKNIVRSTKETSRIQARVAAEELAESLFSTGSNLVPKQMLFEHFADIVLKQSLLAVKNKQVNDEYAKTAKLYLYNETWGLNSFFGKMDVREIRTKHFVEYHRNIVAPKRLSSSVENRVRIYFRKVIQEALFQDIVDTLPVVPKLSKQKQTTRSFFRFHPLVSKEQDDWELLKKVAKESVGEKSEKNHPPITTELYDIILFIVHSFLRPTVSELYSIKHSDITIAENPKRLLITIRKGKTGYRVIDTMPAAVSVYQRMRKRYPNSTQDDFIVFPSYKNRKTPMYSMVSQFDYVLKKAGLKIDRYTGHKHSLYSCRHTCLNMRLVLSQGKINLFALAKNAGHSVATLENYYLKNLPNSQELARNIQSFGD